MSKLIAVMGESGAGKTTSMRNLDPKTTMYIDCDKKGLSWKGWREQYNKKNKNYIVSDDPDYVLKMVQMVSNSPEFQHINVVIIDTINGLMVADEMRRIKEKGYDKWQDLAISVYNLVDKALTFRDDLTIIFTAHTQTDREDSGYMFTHIKTSGRKLDKIVLESKFPVVLLAKVMDGAYKFETKADSSTAKVPMGAIEDQYIDNDITKVIDALKDY